jgi:DNA-binding PadR family transcriptional regulator
MHPYRMQTLIVQRGKDQIANTTQRNSIYQTIDALHRAGLIRARATVRDAKRPERTLYEATPEGRTTLRNWIRQGLSTIAREFPEFPAVLSTLYGVAGASDLRDLLAARATAVQTRLTELRRPYPRIPRLFLLEQEYLAALANAELEWLRSIDRDLGSGKLTFPSKAEMMRIESDLGRPSEGALDRLAAETALKPAKSRRASRRKRASTK